MKSAASNRFVLQSDGANAQLWDYFGNDNQKWYLINARYSNYGAATTYRDIPSSDPACQPTNCLGYALELSSKPDIRMSSSDSVYIIYSKVENYVKNTLGRGCTYLGLNNVGNNALLCPYEYRIAMRVGNHGESIYDYDYHFWIQLNTGEWAHKPGNLPSKRLYYADPVTASWPKGNNPNFYDSDTLFFAVTR